MKHSAWLRLLLFLAALLAPAYAHVGSKDVFEQVSAGPYKLFITIRPPRVIPGIATIEVRSTGAAIRSLSITPIPMSGEASKHPPVPDALKPSKIDPAFYTGYLWLMNQGSWKVRVAVDGAAGSETASVPVPAVATEIRHMQWPMGVLLGTLGLILIIGLVCIVDASVNEAKLAPGMQPGPDRRRRTVVASVVTLTIVGLIAYGYDKWWDVLAAQSAAQIYHASELRLTLRGNTLDLLIGNSDAKQPGVWTALNNTNLLPDHGHLMHLYAIRMPEMDAAFHLHPEPVGKQGLRDTLPSMPSGTYKLFADVVFPNGFAETETATLAVPVGMSTAPLASEDASASPPPLSAGELGPSYKLPDGYTMVWDRPANVEANKGYSFRFTLLDPMGKSATDMQPYLGMAGHAAFVKSDGSTFAHTHPEGSAAMPAMMLANPDQNPQVPDMGGMDSMPGMNMASEAVSPTVEFPYGFPSSGRYRIFVQMKHGATVETGVFDAEVR